MNLKAMGLTTVAILCASGIAYAAPAQPAPDAAQLASRAWRELNRRDYDASIADAKTVLKTDAHSTSALGAIYRAYMAKKDWNNALIYCKKYLEEMPDSHNSNKDAYVICTALHRYSEASQYYMRWKNRTERELEEIKARANKADRPDSGPTTFSVLENLDAREQTKRGRTVTPEMQRTLRTTPSNEDLRFERAKLLWQKHDYLTALPDFEALSKAHPDDMPLHLQCAQCYLYMKRYADGAREFRKVLSLPPNRSKFSIQWWTKDEIYARCGECFEGAKNYDEAIKTYTEALKYDADDTFYERRGDCYVAKSLYSRAVEDYSSAAELVKYRGSRVLLKRANAYTKMGLADKAKADRQLAAKADADYSRRKEELPPGIEGAEDLDQILKFARPIESGGKQQMARP